MSDSRIPFKIGQPKKQIVSKTVSHPLEMVFRANQNVAFNSVTKEPTHSACINN